MLFPSVATFRVWPAASRLHFGKPSDRPNLAEAVTLAVIPQRPASRTGPRQRAQFSISCDEGDQPPLSTLAREDSPIVDRTSREA